MGPEEESQLVKQLSSSGDSPHRPSDRTRWRRASSHWEKSTVRFVNINRPVFRKSSQSVTLLSFRRTKSIETHPYILHIQKAFP